MFAKNSHYFIDKVSKIEENLKSFHDLTLQAYHERWPYIKRGLSSWCFTLEHWVFDYACCSGMKLTPIGRRIQGKLMVRIYLDKMDKYDWKWVFSGENRGANKFNNINYVMWIH